MPVGEEQGHRVVEEVTTQGHRGLSLLTFRLDSYSLKIIVHERRVVSRG